ncbi:SOUL family heme-binding protein [Mycolicibacterium brisbanense]|uniref:SOUL heme-binding protein n=1 Tax=Mycolicibacterium brisbanense TaxID=146020 RepID=A0A117I572_9MYCO|nr:heme-binding protein [Mycolicibacterium brisbanense]MCV7160907.1 heme-binding protein [Mycolicibacterium brisbanense]GAS88085.1 SOUL heme-binding protein [Mycolicibacterium brisbanense]
MLTQLQTAATRVLEIAGSTVGIRLGVEEPPHTARSLVPGVQIRHYGPRIAAETRIHANEEAARSAGFRRLARYIFGANQQREAIAMTMPVGQQGSEQRSWVIRFYLPTGSTLQSLPTPDDEHVALVELAPETVAVLRFSGDRGPSRIAEKTRQLRETLRDYGFAPVGEPSAWFYDPPWTLACLRRNEIAIAVEA